MKKCLEEFDWIFFTLPLVIEVKEEGDPGANGTQLSQMIDDPRAEVFQYQFLFETRQCA